MYALRLYFNFKVCVFKIMKNDSDDYLSVNIEQNNVLLLHVFIGSVPICLY